MIPKSKKTSFTSLPSSLTEQIEQTFSNSASTQKKSETSPLNSTEQTADKITAPSIQPVPELAKPAVKITETAETSSGTKGAKKQNRDGQINICVPPEIKTEWKVLFTSCNVNMTQGITFAIEHLKREIAEREVTLSIGGVIPRKR